MLLVLLVVAHVISVCWEKGNLIQCAYQIHYSTERMLYALAWFMSDDESYCNVPEIGTQATYHVHRVDNKTVKIENITFSVFDQVVDYYYMFNGTRYTFTTTDSFASESLIPTAESNVQVYFDYTSPHRASRSRQRRGQVMYV